MPWRWGSTLRRAELLLLLGFLVAALLVVVFGVRESPTRRFFDPRPSTRLTGPNGAAALARILDRLGVEVRERRHPLFALADEGANATPSGPLALLAPVLSPTPAEVRALRDWVARGNVIFVAGSGRIERCFGYRIAAAEDSLEVRHPPGLDSLPRVNLYLREATGTDEAETAPQLPFVDGTIDACAELAPLRRDTLLATADGRPVALRLGFGRGARATLLAEPAYVTNRVLRETDAALLVIPWLLEGDPGRITFDEYHHGFGLSRSIWSAAWGWLISTPGGWALLQLAAVALLALAFAAVRFGPAQSAILRRRRSALEHVDALAVGLERARGRDTAVLLIVEGLRRRLSPNRPGGRRAEDLGEWLGTLSLAAPHAAARGLVERLEALTHGDGGDERVLEAARTVEELWKELGR